MLSALDTLKDTTCDMLCFEILRNAAFPKICYEHTSNMFLNMVELKFYVCCKPTVRIQCFPFIHVTGHCNQLNIYVVTLPVIAFAEHLQWACN
jgi:hypothetical protein